MTQATPVRWFPSNVQVDEPGNERAAPGSDLATRPGVLPGAWLRGWLLPADARTTRASTNSQAPAGRALASVGLHHTLGTRPAAVGTTRTQRGVHDLAPLVPRPLRRGRVVGG